MPVLKKLTGSGASALLASNIVGDCDFGPAPFTGATATGTTQAGAYQITAVHTRFGTVAASSGCVLPLAAPGDAYVITNYGANSLTVYPPLGGAANNGSANAGVAVAANASLICICMDNAGLGWATK